MRAPLAAALAFAAAALLAPGRAGAQPDTQPDTQPAPTAAPAAPPEAAPPEAEAPEAWETLPGTDLPPFESPLVKRDPPDYDGRPPASRPGPALLWLPRVLLFPLHVLFEYVLRRPFGELLTQAEKNQWQALLYDVFTFGEGNDVGLVPTFFFDFGFQPSVGVYFFANDVGVEGHEIRIIGGFGGLDWYRATIIDRYRPSDAVEIALEGSFWDRPDMLFHGLGWQVDRGERTRYAERTFEGTARLRIHGWRRSRLAVEVGVLHREFEDSDFRNDPSVSEGVQRGFFDALPPGFEAGYTAYRQRLAFSVDSRQARPQPQHGVRAAASVEQAFNLARPAEQRWIEVGGTLGGYVDLSRHRTLGLNVFAGLTEPLGTAEVPFAEQPTLGEDPLLLSGFLPGFLRDDSVFVTTLEYRYPIWVLLDGSLHASIGNVFDGAFDDFRFERLRMSFGVSFRGGDPDNSLTLAIAVGTQPFVQGPNVDSVRVVFGTSPL